MKELQDIIAIWEQLQESQTAALATLVKVVGSTYRRPGARMLIAPDTQVGSLSGGCLESDVLERAQSVIENGCPVLVEYDTTADDDLIWGLGLGCQGVATVLIERPGDEPNALSVIARCLSQRQPGALATVFQGEGTNVKVGDRLLWFPDGEVNQIQNTQLAQCVRQDLQAAMGKTSTVQTYRLTEGMAEVFLEVIEPPTALVIFGVGFDAVPLVRFAKELGWHVTVVDPKARPATVERFSAADCVVLGFSESKQITFDEHTVAVIMTHNYLYDLELLPLLLPLSLTYLGILGPKQRTARLLAELQEGFHFNSAQHLYSPVGLDIGADNPEEIALAIAAEIQAVLQKRPGGFLKERNGSIHSRSERDGSENFSRTDEAVKQ